MSDKAAKSQDEEIPPDNKMIQSLINMKNLILQKMRLSSNNLLTFARAHPMVYLSKKEGVKPCNNDTKSCDFNMKGHVLQRLEDTGKQFKVKFDILTNQFVKEIAKNGSKLLHITSDIEAPKKLCVEGRWGVCNDITLKSMEKTFKQISPFGLQIDVVGIALPNSTDIGHVFKNANVKHVLCFDIDNPDMTPGQFDDEQSDQIVRFRYNYIYNFCLQFYMGIAN